MSATAMRIGILSTCPICFDGGRLPGCGEAPMYCFCQAGEEVREMDYMPQRFKKRFRPYWQYGKTTLDFYVVPRAVRMICRANYMKRRYGRQRAKGMQPIDRHNALFSYALTWLYNLVGAANMPKRYKYRLRNT